MQGNIILYLVQFKNFPDQKYWQWRDSNYFSQKPSFQQKFNQFQSKRYGLKNQGSMESKNLFVKSSEKEVKEKISQPKKIVINSNQQNQPKKISIDKEALKEKIKSSLINQQVSLDKFVVKSGGKEEQKEQKGEKRRMEEEKGQKRRVQKVPQKKEEDSKSREDLSKSRESKEDFSNSRVREMQKNEQKSREMQKQKNEQKRREMQKQKQKSEQKRIALGSLIEKIRGIKTIKSYQVRKDGMYFDVEAWDKGGQTLFVPPLSTKVVQSIDQKKLALFLQDCLLRRYQQIPPKVSIKIN